MMGIERITNAIEINNVTKQYKDFSLNQLILPYPREPLWDLLVKMELEDNNHKSYFRPNSYGRRHYKSSRKGFKKSTQRYKSRLEWYLMVVISMII